MKRCSQCNQTYNDDLNFCLTDGSQLVSLNSFSSEETVIRPAPIFQQPVQTVRHGVSPLFAYAAIGLLALLAGGAVVFWIKSGSTALPDTKNETTNTVSTPTEQKSVVSNEQQDNLSKQQEALERERQKLAEERKKLEAKKSETSPSPASRPPRSNLRAFVNTKDKSGLYLRSDKSLTSEAVVFAPEGGEVAILYYDNEQTAINGRVGRWCRARYAGVEGWAWEFYLVVR